MKQAKVVILEDHTLIAHLLKDRVEKYNFISSVVVYTSSAHFMAHIDALECDLLIIDLMMPEISGTDVIRAIRSKKGIEELKIVVISSIVEAKVVREVIDAGANAFLAKNTSPEELEMALAHVMSTQQVYIGTSLKEAIIQAHFEPDKHIKLTEKERIVLEHLCNGSSVATIAQLMFLSTHSIQAYIKKLFFKFEVNKTKDLILKAMKQK